MKIVASIGSGVFVLVVAGGVPVATSAEASATRVRVYDQRVDRLSDVLPFGSIRQANGFLIAPNLDENEERSVLERVAELLRATTANYERGADRGS